MYMGLGVYLVPGQSSVVGYGYASGFHLRV